MRQKRHIDQGRVICRPELLELPLLTVAPRERSNLTALSVSVGKLRVNCETCGLELLKPAAWAKRVSRHYCSNVCAGIGKRQRKQVPCVICGTQMLVTPAYKGSTCSAECSRKLKAKIDPMRQRDEHGRRYARRPLATA